MFAHVASKGVRRDSGQGLKDTTSHKRLKGQYKGNQRHEQYSNLNKTHGILGKFL